MGERWRLSSLLTKWSMRLPGVWQNADRGAWATVYAAASPDAEPGGYYGPGGVFELTGPPAKARQSARARDEAVAARLWDESERLTGVTYHV